MRRRASITETLKECRKCGKLKPFSEFYKHRANVGGLSYRCKPCQNAWGASYRERRRSAPEPDLNGMTRICVDCAKDKPITDFPKNPLGNLGYERVCKLCNNERTRVWNENNPGRKAAAVRQKIYALSPERYVDMVVAQNGCCAICGMVPVNKPKGGFQVDHCHSTGVVRGLLCFNCNNGLGKFKDDIDRLRKAVAYLERFET